MCLLSNYLDIPPSYPTVYNSHLGFFDNGFPSLMGSFGYCFSIKLTTNFPKVFNVLCNLSFLVTNHVSTSYKSDML